MPLERRDIKCDHVSYFQYHNRIASFLDWNLDWEIDKSKPSPEQLARAGFFLYATKPFLADNVVCPYCDLALDTWEPRDEPLRIHQTRSPSCSFVLGRQIVRNMDDASSNNLSTNAEPKATEMEKEVSNEEGHTSPASRLKQRHTRGAAGVPKRTLQQERKISHTDWSLPSAGPSSGPKRQEPVIARAFVAVGGSPEIGNTSHY